MHTSRFLIYGANGYTGSLVARAAAARGQQPILAGRDALALATLGRELALEHRIFALDNPIAAAEGIRGVRVVLHCAGPFAHTSKPMADACLLTGAHYLDITGEVSVFEALAARDQEARAAQVMLLPGVGFDVVPSDCLAAHLKRRLPLANRLSLGFQTFGRVSRGTATTMAENIAGGGLVRRDGLVRSVPAAWKTRVIDFGVGPTKAITIPWGDVSTAFHSTGIPNIEVYTAAPLGLRLAARATRRLGWFLGSSIVQGFLKRRIKARPAGPSEDERATGMSFLWGEAKDAAGQKAVSRLRGPEAYTMTVQAALAVVERVLAGEATPGFQTPSNMYGPDFVLGLENVVREDE
ncbi:MAG: saccharopine dehydrogenase NADP-binding domain-containing protein [Gemmataceae bacterium]|nr:saccharopine dehydrogenase NADP-binding domain-containing protein [Gemmataceae bacterium]MCI0739322.1 saccharopine dehydrogenase NADP-binding domain-containing protein [Gemmataceae bacterium]